MTHQFHFQGFAQEKWKYSQPPVPMGAGPTGAEDWLLYTIVPKGLENPWILESTGLLDPMSRDTRRQLYMITKTSVHKFSSQLYS